MRWMDLESVIQSEVSQKEKQILYANAYIWNPKRRNKKNKYCMITHIYGIQKRKKCPATRFINQLMNLVAGQE